METKCSLSERDIITKYILPAIEASGWDKRNQIREEVSFTAGRIFVKGKLTKRGEKKRAFRKFALLFVCRATVADSGVLSLS